MTTTRLAFFSSLRRWAPVVAAFSVFALTLAPSYAQDQPDWSLSFGLDVIGDPDEPYAGDTGLEAAFWYSVSTKLDVGARVGLLSYESEGLPPDDGPILVGGEGDLVTLDLGLRFFPGSGTSQVYPFLGAAIVVPISDSFDGQREDLGGGSGISVDADWDPESVGFSAEVGVRWDVSEKVYLEAAASYLTLGVDTIRIVDVDPLTVDETIIDTDLDALSFGVNVGFYF